jgi:hypothetical protein
MALVLMVLRDPALVNVIRATLAQIARLRVQEFLVRSAVEMAVVPMARLETEIVYVTLAITIRFVPANALDQQEVHAI